MEKVYKLDIDGMTVNFPDKLNKLIKSVIKSMDKYEFNNVGSEIYNFVWENFCDSYIEMSKFSLDQISTKSTLYYCLKNIVKLLHPFMPFVTEEIYNNLPFKDNETIMLSKYPEYNSNLIFEETKNL